MWATEIRTQKSWGTSQGSEFLTITPGTRTRVGSRCQLPCHRPSTQKQAVIECPLRTGHCTRGHRASPLPQRHRAGPASKNSVCWTLVSSTVQAITGKSGKSPFAYTSRRRQVFSTNTSDSRTFRCSSGSAPRGENLPSSYSSATD